MLVALGAQVTIVGPGGPRTIWLEDFFITPETNVRRENQLKDGEIVSQILIPAPTGKSHYIKFKERESLDFAMSAVGAVIELNADKTVKTARVVLGGVASIPWRVPDVEKFLTGKALSDDNIAKAADMALDGAAPLEHNGYKVPLTQALVRRTLAKLARVASSTNVASRGLQQAQSASNRTSVFIFSCLIVYNLGNYGVFSHVRKVHQSFRSCRRPTSAANCAPRNITCTTKSSPTPRPIMMPPATRGVT